MAAWTKMRVQLREWARRIKRNVLALWFSLRHKQTPLPAKLVAALVVAYALSPIDLIPDFIPVLGYLDDVILVPLGVLLAMKLIPAPVWADCQAQAQRWMDEARGKPTSRVGAIVIVLVWLLLAWLCWVYARRWFQ
jgi:uncharacterized membrane protein YkvA (DUF1232 family)